MRIFLIFCLLTTCAAQMCLAHDYTMSYDNVPISTKTWEEIGIKWDNGYGKLLRPISYAEKHGLTAGECRYFNLTEFGVPHAKITITYTKPLLKWQVHQLLHDKQPVIGIYIHQTKDVRTYRFTDKHGHISTLNVTPNHPFYVKSLHAYLPISHITNTMSLDGVQHQSLYLLCLRHQHCGVIYEPNKFKTVYNLEVAQQHFFRVGVDEIRVHNSTTGIRVGPLIEGPEAASHGVITYTADELRQAYMTVHGRLPRAIFSESLYAVPRPAGETYAVPRPTGETYAVPRPAGETYAVPRPTGETYAVPRPTGETAQALPPQSNPTGPAYATVRRTGQTRLRANSLDSIYESPIPPEQQYQVIPPQTAYAVPRPTEQAYQPLRH